MSTKRGPTLNAGPLSERFFRLPLSGGGCEFAADQRAKPAHALVDRRGRRARERQAEVVLAAAMWNQPHLVILDEPTNYLDRDSLGALARAVEEFEGGVVIISHNSEFVSQVCNEEWVMDAGHLTTKGGEGAWMDRQEDKISDAPVITEMTDALGNVSEIKVKKKRFLKLIEKS